jgi:ABC-type transport system involved in multi-copper enzyme maturation permease subunit
MIAMRALWTLTHLTLHEAARRRVLTAALIGGLAFLTLYAIGLHFIVRESSKHMGPNLVERQIMLNVLTLAALYVVHFLTLMSAVLLPVDTLSGEIASGVIQTVASKPVRRSTVVLGKWLAYALVTSAYLLLMAAGVVLVSRVIGHFSPRGVDRGVPLMALSALAMMTLSIAGGTRLSTVTNGILAFGLFGLAFIGGWVDQIGAMTHNQAAVNVGTIASLILPSEAMWQLASWHMQPPIMRDLQLTPFSPASVPSTAMIGWAAGYIAVVLLIGLRQFSKRPL